MTDTFISRIGDWLKHQLVEEVPDELSRCEFGCRRLECRMGEWETCERRLQEAQDLHEWKVRNQ